MASSHYVMLKWAKYACEYDLSLYAFLSCYLPIQLLLKSLPGACDVTSFSPCTDSSHQLQDLQHFMFEQIVLKRLQLLLV